MFRINTPEFVIGAARSEQFPAAPYPEVAFAGRSNVGKSSLLNLLTARKGLAKTSSTPGKTQQINFFKINNRYHLVDLPGYGYAKVSKTDREAWAHLIESYLCNRTQLRLVVALTDIRHDPTELDLHMYEWLDAVGIPYVVVLTKYDKVSPGAADSRVGQIRELTDGYASCRDVIAVSSQTRHNRDKLLGTIGAVLEERIAR